MSEKVVDLNRLSLISKRDVSRAYAQVKALQEEIEASRERAESIIEVRQHPYLPHFCISYSLHLERRNL